MEKEQYLRASAGQSKIPPRGGLVAGNDGIALVLWRLQGCAVQPQRLKQR